MDQRVRLLSLDVEGFRGANKRVHLDFGPNATVLSAWNGRGKSTLLGAIEWALWGELKFQAPENHTHDELNSMFNSAGRASVQLMLSQGGREIKISREKTVRKKDSQVEVKDGAKTLADEEAQSFIFRLTGLSFDDFYRAAFLHQESIRGLLTEEQKDRDEALDRLFGVERDKGPAYRDSSQAGYQRPHGNRGQRRQIDGSTCRRRWRCRDRSQPRSR